MSAHKLYWQMMETAKSDLRALEHMLDSEAFDDRVFGFHVQQATEKLFKAWLSSLQLEFPYTHDLSLLLDMLRNAGADVGPWWALLDFSGFAVRFRYDNLPLHEQPVDRLSAIAEVRGLYQHVEALRQEDQDR